MIRSLEVRDLVVIERAEMAPARGLTAVTGETGAGKTVLAQALGLLAGAPANPAAVRPGARHALVQATLAVPSGFWDGLDEDDPAAALRELVDDEAEVVIARRVPAEGRARALVDGQAAPVDAVASLARALVRFSAQHEGRRLVAPATQLAVLDAFAGPEAQTAAERLRGLRRRLRGLERAIAARRERREAAERRRAELEELVAAVEAAAPDPEEEAALVAERGRLAHAGRLAEAVAAAAEALSPADGEGGAIALAGAAARALEPLTGVDDALVAPRDELRAAEAALQETGLALRAYLDGLEAEPGRLAQIEERLDVYARLGRRYGGGAAEMLARAEEARAALAELDEGRRGGDALGEERGAVLAEARELAAGLRARRAEAAPRLCEAAQRQLADLAMPHATLRVQLGEDDGDPPAGRAVIWLRANPGMREAPLGDVASGGELSRVLLALHGAASGADRSAWVLDEVDAGIGGVTAAAVGARLAALARGRQVVVITHLPQVAAMAEAHYRLVKGVDAGGRATTRIEPVAGDGLVAELCRMLGAGPADAGARRHAEELLARRAA